MENELNPVPPENVPSRTLKSGMVIPAIGMGTFGNDKFSSEQVSDAVYGAIKCGYRLFDCAAAYGNEHEIGKVFERAFTDGIVKREDLTIMSKVWNDMHGAGDVLVACAKTLRDLRLDYLDIYMVHWPFPNSHKLGATLADINPDNVPFSVEEYMSVWRQMEHLHDLGLVRSIGMSNMTIKKLEQVLPLCRIQPDVLECEISPSFQQWELFDYCRAHSIQLIGYSPLGSPARPARDTEAQDIVTFDMPVIRKIAEAHHCHPAIICVKWAVQRGHIPIPFSIDENEYLSNLRSATEDPLTDEEMQAIKDADPNFRLIKGKVFLWPGAKTWRAIWDEE